MKTAVDVAIPLITFLLMAAVGLDLTPGDFRRLGRRPRLIAAGLVGPLLLLPPAALLVIHALGASDALAAGLLLVAICPVGGISNTYSYLARASTALSVSLTGLSCLLATVTIPALTFVFEAALGRPLGLSVPIRLLFAQLVVILATPIALGMLVRRRWPEAAARHERGLRLAGFIALGLLIVVVVVDQGPEFRRHLADAVALAAGFVLLSGLAGLGVARLVARERADTFTLAVEFATRNVAVATAVAVTLAGRVEMAVFATTYFLTEVPIMLAAVAWYRRGARRDPRPARR
jgi:BASS family bile acid:Na+ symporter